MLSDEMLVVLVKTNRVVQIETSASLVTPAI